MSDNKKYIHGFTSQEQQRLVAQARLGEHKIYSGVDFSESQHILEIGSGVGAQTEILLRRFPDLEITCIELSDLQIEAANKYLGSFPQFEGRYRIIKADATNTLLSEKFDGAFVCWLLEHVSQPKAILNEAKRLLRAGSKIVITEVMNSSFFLDPYSPSIWKYWMAFNDYQFEHAGDPFVGSKLGNYLVQTGYQNIDTSVLSWHLDVRYPEQRKRMIRFWKDLLLSGSQVLLDNKIIDDDLLKSVKFEFEQVESHPDAIFHYSFMQAKAFA